MTATAEAACAPLTPPSLVQPLPWDFKETFPQPTAEAIEAGTLLEEDATPESIRCIHQGHAREALATLHALDVVMDARRRAVDPDTGQAPRTQAARERLIKRF